MKTDFMERLFRFETQLWKPWWRCSNWI